MVHRPGPNPDFRRLEIRVKKEKFGLIVDDTILIFLLILDLKQDTL